MLRGSFRSDALTGERYFKWRGGDVSRLEGLADAVFALALTLLVVRLEVPRSFAEVQFAIERAPVYLACFSVFLWIWYCHYQFHRRYGLEGPLTVAVDGALLFVVLLLALPLRFVAEMMYESFSYGHPPKQRDEVGNLVLGPDGEPLRMFEAADGGTLLSFYAAGFALVFFCFALQTWRAYRMADELELDDVERLVTRNTIRAHGLTVVIASVSFGLANFGGRMAWLSGPIFFAMGPGHGVLGWLQGRKVDALAREKGIVDG